MGLCADGELDNGRSNYDRFANSTSNVGGTPQGLSEVFNFGLDQLYQMKIEGEEGLEEEEAEASAKRFDLLSWSMVRPSTSRRTRCVGAIWALRSDVAAGNVLRPCAGVGMMCRCGIPSTAPWAVALFASSSGKVALVRTAGPAQLVNQS